METSGLSWATSMTNWTQELGREDHHLVSRFAGARVVGSVCVGGSCAIEFVRELCLSVRYTVQPKPGHTGWFRSTAPEGGRVHLERAVRHVGGVVSAVTLGWIAPNALLVPAMRGMGYEVEGTGEKMSALQGAVIMGGLVGTAYVTYLFGPKLLASPEVTRAFAWMQSLSPWAVKELPLPPPPATPYGMYTLGAVGVLALGAAGHRVSCVYKKLNKGKMGRSRVNVWAATKQTWTQTREQVQGACTAAAELAESTKDKARTRWPNAAECFDAAYGKVTDLSEAVAEKWVRQVTVEQLMNGFSFKNGILLNSYTGTREWSKPQPEEGGTKSDNACFKVEPGSRFSRKVRVVRTDKSEVGNTEEGFTFNASECAALKTKITDTAFVAAVDNAMKGTQNT